MKRFILALAMIAAGVATAKPQDQGYVWYHANGRPASGANFQGNLSGCKDSEFFVSHAAEQCMRRAGFSYEPRRYAATGYKTPSRKTGARKALKPTPAAAASKARVDAPLLKGAPIVCPGFSKQGSTANC